VLWQPCGHHSLNLDLVLLEDAALDVIEDGAVVTSHKAKKGDRVIVDQDAPFERISVSNGVQVLEGLHAAIWHCDRPAMLAIKPALENPGMGVKVLQKRLGVLTLARRESKQV